MQQSWGCSQNQMKKTRNDAEEVGALKVHIYAYVRLPWLVIYISAMLLCFAAMFRVTNQIDLTDRHWLAQDIPWLLLVLIAWMPMFQWLRNRHHTVEVVFDENQRRCQIVGWHVAGDWKVRKQQTSRIASRQAGAIVMTILVSFMFLIDFFMLYHAFHVPVTFASGARKAMAVQNICIPLGLASVSVRLFSVWKYPQLVLLHRKGEWLSIQW
jgi:hypothetical protein